MEIRKMFFDGITYNVFTDQELEDYKEYILPKLFMKAKKY